MIYPIRRIVECGRFNYIRPALRVPGRHPEQPKTRGRVKLPRYEFNI